MRQTVAPGPRTGRAAVPASKSRAHRLLICAAAGGRETVLKCRGISRDIEATIACLRAMGSEITLGEDGIIGPVDSDFRYAGLTEGRHTVWAGTFEHGTVIARMKEGTPDGGAFFGRSC